MQSLGKNVKKMKIQVFVISASLVSAFMVLLPELLRFVGLPDTIAANMRQIIYGLILIGVIVWQEKVKSVTFTYGTRLSLD